MYKNNLDGQSRVKDSLSAFLIVIIILVVLFAFLVWDSEKEFLDFYIMQCAVWFSTCLAL